MAGLGIVGSLGVAARGPRVSPPTAPSNLAAATNYDVGGRVDLTWTDNSDDETGFIVSQSTDNSTYTDIHTTAADATSYSVTGLTNDTLYYFKVRATSADGDSASTSAATATPRIHPSDISGIAVAFESINTITDDSGLKVWNDASGNGLHTNSQDTAGARPTITASNADAGNRRTFSGDGGDYLTVNDNAALDVGTGAFMVMAVCKQGATGDRMVCGKDSFNGGGFVGFFLQWNQTGFANKWNFATRNGGGANNQLFGTSTTSVGWHMVMGVRDGSGNKTLYINNAANGTQNDSSVDVDNTSAFKLFTADDALNQKWDGELAAVVVVKGAISAGDRTSLYNRYVALYGI
jgi:hypothetical protein